MKLSPKHFIFFLIPLYFLSRTINLKIVPIFTDEAIYAHWAQIAIHDPANRFISLEDGKQPLFIWLAAVFQRFQSDPLIATRLVSVVSGFFSLVGIYLLSKTLFSTKVAILSAFLYAIVPFTLLYDRMALYDSLLTSLGIWSVLFLVKLAKRPALDNSLLAGIAMGLSLITKSSGAFFMFLAPAAILNFSFKDKNLPMKIAKWISLVVLAAIIAQVIYNALRLSPLFYVIAQKNSEFIRSISEVLEDPFVFFSSNSLSLATWLVEYISLPLFVIFLFGAVYGLYKKNLQIIYLSILTVVPFLFEALFNKVIYPRFLLFFFPYMLIIIAYALGTIHQRFAKQTKYFFLLLVLIVLQPMSNSFKLLTDPSSAKIASSDSNQYFNDWPAGYGIDPIREIITRESKNKDVYMGTEGTFGLLPFALQIYFYDTKNVHLFGYWPVSAQNLPDQILEYAKNNKTFFVFNENQSELNNPNLIPVAKYQKGAGNSYMRLFEIKP